MSHRLEVFPAASGGSSPETRGRPGGRAASEATRRIGGRRVDAPVGQGNRLGLRPQRRPGRAEGRLRCVLVPAIRADQRIRIGRSRARCRIRRGLWPGMRDRLWWHRHDLVRPGCRCGVVISGRRQWLRPLPVGVIQHSAPSSRFPSACQVTPATRSCRGANGRCHRTDPSCFGSRGSGIPLRDQPSNRRTSCPAPRGGQRGTSATQSS